MYRHLKVKVMVEQVDLGTTGKLMRWSKIIFWIASCLQETLHCDIQFLSHMLYSVTLHLQHCMWYHVHVHHKAPCAGFVPQKCADELHHMLAEVKTIVSCCREIEPIIDGTSLCANNVSTITGVCVSIKTSLIFCTLSFSIKNSIAVILLHH